MNVFAGTVQDPTLHWSAILAGVIIAIVVQSLFNLLGFGLGLTAFSADAEVVKNIATGSVAWLMISTIFSMFIGGWVTGRSCCLMNRAGAALHGLLMWGTAALLTVTLLTTATGILVSNTLNTIEGDIENIQVNPQPSLEERFNGEPTQQGMEAAAVKTTNALGTVSFIAFSTALVGAIFAVLGAIAAARNRR